ncbi:hypothetical protein [Maioricimonas rarisocia]|uniref:hypothetical protein n=1 Tax=Maioricimonas rarisocia TaxID=2528026 RepID=UPI0011A3C25B|nr:hypothetical protein [Maioricimonas rarisocia]
MQKTTEVVRNASRSVRALLWSSVAACLGYVAFTSRWSAFLVLGIPFLWGMLASNADWLLPTTDDQRSGLQRRLRFFLGAGQIWIGGTLYWCLLTWPVIATTPRNRVLCILGAACLGIAWPLTIAGGLAVARNSRISLAASLSLIWCTLEWMRTNTPDIAFGHGALEHALFQWPVTYQLADIGGQHVVGLVLVFAGSAVGVYADQAIRIDGSPEVLARNVKACRSAVCLLGLVFGYGIWRTATIPRPADAGKGSGAFCIGLLQTDVEGVSSSPTDQRGVLFDECQALMQSCAEPVDLFVCPEASCPLRVVDVAPEYLTRNWRGEERKEKTRLLSMLQQTHDEELSAAFRRNIAPRLMTMPVLKYRGTAQAGRDLTHGAVLIREDRSATVVYEKRHLAPFIERVPRSLRYLGWKFTEDFSPGDSYGHLLQRIRSGVAVRNASQRRTSPDVIGCMIQLCYDTSLPGAPRSQMLYFSRSDRSPDCVLALSNVETSAGSVMGRLHMACQVFRAAENRLTYLCSTNCGTSAWVDPAGRIVTSGDAGDTEIVFVRANGGGLRRPAGLTLYTRFGDVVPMLCMVVLALVGLKRSRCILLR